MGRTALPIFQAGRAAAMCSNQADFHLTLTCPKNVSIQPIHMW